MALHISRRAAARLLPRNGSTFGASTRAASTVAQVLPRDVKMDEQLKRESLLPNADPTTSSPSTNLTSQHMPFMVATYSRPPPVFTTGAGCRLFDLENRSYIDLMAGIAVNALGHADPGMADILYRQASQLVHSSNLYHNPWTGALSKLIVETSQKAGFSSASRVFVCNSGSEANEAALKFARKVGKLVGGDTKTDFVSFHNSFHGRTFGSLSATPTKKYQAPFAPMVPGFSYGTYNDLGSLDLITDSTCGVIVEPIQGEGGVHVASREFLSALRKKCDETGAVLIFDEIQCGLSRTGDLWAHTASGVQPDILTMAKALGNGFPIGATMVSEKVSEKVVVGDHGTTFGGNPLACRVGHYVFGRLAGEEVGRNVEMRGKELRGYLEEIKVEFPGEVVEVRGRGLIMGLEMKRDPTGVVTEARERGALVITAGCNTLRFVPPLVIGKEELRDGMGIVREAIRAWLKTA